MLENAVPAKSTALSPLTENPDARVHPGKTERENEKQTELPVYNLLNKNILRGIENGLVVEERGYGSCNLA